MADKTNLGDRMKEYEAVPRIKLTRRMPMIIRVDGKAFHTYTRGFDKPWDDKLVRAMNYAAQALMDQVQGAKLAYVQSDEISILATDYDKLLSAAWFDKNVQKMCSVAASVATAAFNAHMACYDGGAKTAHFDARCFALPQAEVCNYFIWRQQDATRNSIMGLAQKYFSHKQLHGVNTGQAQEKLFQEHGINWNDCETWQKRGWCVIRKRVEMTIEEAQSLGTNDPEAFFRNVIESDWDIPIFTQDREYVESKLPS